MLHTEVAEIAGKRVLIPRTTGIGPPGRALHSSPLYTARASSPSVRTRKALDEALEYMRAAGGEAAV